MMTLADAALIHGYLDGTIVTEDFARLQDLLRGSAEARRALRDLSTVDAKLTEMAAVNPLAMQVLPMSPLSSPPGIARWFQWRPLAAAAAGLVIGLFSATMVLGYVLPHAGRVTMLLDEGFESGPAPLVTGLPARADVWSGDFSEVVGEQQGVKPKGGERMLRFLRADYEGKPNAEGSYVADLYRLVDLRPYRQDFADGNAKVQISAAFNAIPFRQEEAYSCAVSVYALDAEMTRNVASLNEAMDANGSLAMARKRLANLDRDPGTWQKLEEELRLPAETELLLVHLAVIPAGKSPKRITFDGQYVDDVRITLVRRSSVP
jgi:hypothetical protein